MRTLKRDKGFTDAWNKKSALEKAISEGVHGPPVLRPAERRRYLGHLEERVLRGLTVAQVEEPWLYPEIAAAIKDPRAQRLVLSGSVREEAAWEYLELAGEHRLPFTVAVSPRYSGEIGLLVITRPGVDTGEEIKIPPSRSKHLRTLGLSKKLIDAVGREICSQCRRLLEEKAPTELANYGSLSAWSFLIGRKCPAH